MACGRDRGLSGCKGSAALHQTSVTDCWYRRGGSPHDLFAQCRARISWTTRAYSMKFRSKS